MTKTLVVIGDSTSALNFNPGTPAQHWTAIFSGNIGATVYVLAASGETTIQGLARIPAAVALQPTDSIIMDMANDRGAIVSGAMSLATYKENLRQMVIQLHAGGVAYNRIVLASCPCWRSGIAQYTPLINAMRDVSTEFGCRFRHNFKDYLYENYMNSDAAVARYLTAEDPIHQSIAGNAYLADLFSSEIANGWYGFSEETELPPTSGATQFQIDCEAAILEMKRLTS